MQRIQIILVRLGPSLRRMLPLAPAGAVALLMAIGIIAATLISHAVHPEAAPPQYVALAPTADLTYTANLPMVAVPAIEARCTNIAVNGGFEAAAPWHPWTGVANTTSGVYVDTLISSVRAHRGAKSGRVGSSTLNGVWNEMVQTVPLPANVVITTLTYWRYLDTTETDTATVYDKFTVGIETEQGIQIVTPQQIDNTSSGRGAWVQNSIDLPNASAYSGQRLWLSFKAATDSNLPSSLYVDDVSLTVCALP